MFRRYVRLIAIALVLLAGIGGSAFAQTADELLAVEKALHEAENAHDVNQLMSYCTDDIVFEYVVAGATPLMGKEAVTGFFSALFQAFPDIHEVQRRRLASGNTVLVECTATGTHQGMWIGIPATGKSFQTMHMNIMEFEGKKIKRMTAYDDVVSFLVQIGAMPVSDLPPLTPSFTLPAPEPTGLPPLEADAEAMSHWNNHNMSLWSKMIDPNGDYLYNVLGMPMDRGALVALQELYILAFSDVRGDITRMIDMGDGWVVAEYVFIGTNTGPYFGIPATGTGGGQLRVAWVARYVDGLMTYFHVYFDNLTLLTNMGVVQLPGSTTVVSPSTWGQIKSMFQR